MKHSRSVIIWAVLAAFVGLALAAALPHLHSDGAPSHDCFACRAHSAQPTLESPAASGTAPPPLLGKVAADRPDLPPQAFFSLPATRAPPLLS